MREITKTFKVYKFNELNETAKNKALFYFSDINTDYDWWEYIYEEASNLGAEISGFDIGRSNDIDIEVSDYESFAREVIKSHGVNCVTYIDACKFLADAKELLDLDTDDITYEQGHELEEKCSEYLNDIKHEYLKMLRDEYEYRSSEEAITESILANEYEFLENGDLT